MSIHHQFTNNPLTSTMVQSFSQNSRYRPLICSAAAFLSVCTFSPSTICQGCSAGSHKCHSGCSNSSSGSSSQQQQQWRRQRCQPARACIARAFLGAGAHVARAAVAGLRRAQPRQLKPPQGKALACMACSSVMPVRMSMGIFTILSGNFSARSSIEVPPCEWQEEGSHPDWGSASHAHVLEW